MEFSSWLEAKGFDASTLSKEQKAYFQAQWRAEQNAAAADIARAAEGEEPRAEKTVEKTKMDDGPTLDEIVAAGKREQSRIRSITDMVARAIGEDPQKLDTFDKIGRMAIDYKWDVQKADLELLRAGRHSGPLVIPGGVGAPVTGRVMEAALCKAGGLQNVEKLYPEQVLDAADKNYRNGINLGEVVLHFAQANGYTGRTIRDDPWAAIKAALNGPQGNFPEPHASTWGPSTGGGLSGVLSNVQNKFLREGFDFVENSWRQIGARRTVSNFQQISTYSLTGGIGYEKVAPGGEIKHTTLGSEVYTNQIDTRGTMIGIDRRDLINDDLGVFSRVGRRLGRGQAIGINKVFWAAFLNNSSFFTSGRNNVSTGAGSALSLAGLDAANQKFMLQTDADGNLMGATPRILLVPPALDATAMQLMSPMLTIGSGTTATGSTNPWAGRFRVVTSSYMQDSTLTGNSAAAWYLLADPNDVPVIEIAFLNGRETPNVETAEADFNMLGIAMRVYLDYGVSLQEYRGGVRSAGS